MSVDIAERMFMGPEVALLQTDQERVQQIRELVKLTDDVSLGYGGEIPVGTDLLTFFNKVKEIVAC